LPTGNQTALSTESLWNIEESPCLSTRGPITVTIGFQLKVTIRWEK